MPAGNDEAQADRIADRRLAIVPPIRQPVANQVVLVPGGLAVLGASGLIGLQQPAGCWD